MENKLYEASDFALVVYLTCIGRKIRSTRTQGNRVLFLFEDVDDSEVSRFFSGRADKISAFELIRAERRVRNLIKTALGR